MKWCRFEKDGAVAFGFLEDDEVVAVEGTPFEAWTITRRRHPLDAVKLLVPVVPANFYAVGLNYRAHVQWAAERKGLKVQVPKEADVGYRSVNALIPTGADVVIPGDSPGPVEYEGELVAVVGRRAKHLAEADALDCLLGFTLGNDVSERAWQQSDRTLWRAKNTDTFKPMGPVIASGLDPMDQRITVHINGGLVSDYSTAAMVFGVREYLVRMTRYLTLYPGDVIWFGCDGATEPALTPGDVVEVACDRIGVLRNRVVREDRSRAG